MGQLHIGAIKRSKWALLALVFIFTQLIPLYTFNGVADAAVGPNDPTQVVCTNDTQGANDEPGQKDLTKMCYDGSGTPTSVYAEWDWDEISWSGSNTGDACALFDTDGDGFANYAVCVTVGGNPASQQSNSPRIYSCNDSRIDRCAGDSLIAGPYQSQCEVAIANNQPFGQGSDSPKDTVAKCSIKLSEVGGGSVAKLIDVCSFPSQQPNSDPSDCVVIKPNAGKLEVVKIVSPANDTGLFNLKIDGTTYASNVGNNGTTTEKVVTTGSHTISETAGTNTSLTSYTTTIVCKDKNGSGAIIAQGSPTGSTTRQLSVSVADASDIVCIITNTRNNGTLTIIKHVINDNGGTKVAGDFNVHVKTNGTDVTNSPLAGSETGTAYSLTPGTYVVSEDLPVAGYAQTSIVCDGQTTATVTVTSNGNHTCTITNDDQQAYIIVDKTVINDNGGTKVANDFSLTVGGNPVQDGVAYPVNPGTYSAGETNLPGYTPSAWGTDCSAAGSVTVALGETKTCTITNDDDAPVLTLIKSLNPELYGSDATGSDFTLNATKVGQSVPKVTGQDEDATDTTSDVTSDETFQAGTYNLSEESTKYDSPAGQYTSSWECQYTNIVGQTSTITVAQVTLSIGESADCTVTNTFNPAKLTVIKEIVNDNGGNAIVGDFDISLTGKGELTFGSGQVNGSKTTYSTQTYNLNAGNYTLSELKSAGYNEGTWDCGTANTSNAALVATNLVLINGSDVTCKITNNDIAPNLTVVKNVTNDNGGTATVDAFNLQLNSSSLSFGAGVGTTTKAYTATPAVEANKDYTISEIVAGTGYAASNWSCTDNSTGALLVTINLDEAESVTCTITNDDIAPKLKLTKILVKDNGSTAVYTDWVVTATGPTTISGAGTVSSGSGFTAGEYTLSESGPAGYDASAWGCTGGGLLDVDKLTIGLAEEVECTITNDDKAPTLTVVKRIVNDNGGNDSVDSFGIVLNEDALTFGSGSADGTSTLKYVSTPTVLSNTPYTLSEDDVEGYAEGTWSCTDGSTGGLSVILNFDVAEDVTCTITNNDIAPSLTVLKTVINDDGGNETASAFGIKLGDTALSFDGGTVSGTDTKVYTSNPTVVANTQYTLSENDVTGYAEGTWSCYDNATESKVSNPFNLTEGQSVTCEITNNDIAPELTVVKRIVNNNGGTATPSAFNLKIDANGLSFGSGVADGTDTLAYTAKPAVKANTQYTLSEVLSGTGYSGGEWSCSDESNGALNVDVTLQEGQKITCTVTNDDIAPSLTLVKKVINDNGGTADVTDWTLYADGPTDLSGTSGVASGETFKAGSYILSEDSEEWTTAQYDPSNWDCEEANLDGATLSIGLGESVTCTVTNDDIAPKLYIQKLVYTADENPTQEFDFTVEYTQGKETSSNTTTVAANDIEQVVGAKAGTYKISEIDDVEGWVFVYAYCTEGEGNDYSLYSTQTVEGPDDYPYVELKLPLGAEYTCTFTNEELSDVTVFKYNDKNENGVRDNYFNQGLEPVMSGIKFELYSYYYDEIFYATTDENGVATFKDIPSSPYVIREVFEEGNEWRITQFECEGQLYENDDRASVQAAESDVRGEWFYVQPGNTATCTVGNASDNYYYDIAKSNNAPTAKRVGDVVTYTITLTIPEDTGVLHNPRVGDAPPTGFKYLNGSWTASSNLRGNLKPGVSTEPTYASPGVWRFNGFDWYYDEEESVLNNAFYPGEVITLTYQTKIESNVTPGTYPDKALSIAFNTSNVDEQNKESIVIANVQEEGDSPFVGTQVVVVTDTILPTLVNTGSSALWALLMGLGLIVAGVTTRRITATERRMK
jgi:hypothetical protein